MTAKSTDCRARGTAAASSSWNTRLYGFSAISLGVASRTSGSLSLIRPRSCRSSRARPSLVGSLGTAMMAPSAMASRSADLPGVHGHRLVVDGAGGHKVGAVLRVVVIKIVDVLEIVRVDASAVGVLVRQDVIRVLLHHELDTRSFSAGAAKSVRICAWGAGEAATTSLAASASAGALSRKPTGRPRRPDRRRRPGTSGQDGE